MQCRVSILCLWQWWRGTVVSEVCMYAGTGMPGWRAHALSMLLPHTDTDRGSTDADPKITCCQCDMGTVVLQEHKTIYILRTLMHGC